MNGTSVETSTFLNDVLRIVSEATERAHSVGNTAAAFADRVSGAQEQAASDDKTSEVPDTMEGKIRDALSRLHAALGKCEDETGRLPSIG